MNSELRDHMKSLHTSAIDARNGYLRAVEDAKEPGDFTQLFQHMAALHRRNADELAQALADAGERPSEDGSFMSAIHRTIMDIRSLFGGLDESVLPGLIDGEERNVASYGEALGFPETDGHAGALLSAQRDRLMEAIRKMRAAHAAT